jgi:hypothetical protein
VRIPRERLGHLAFVVVAAALIAVAGFGLYRSVQVDRRPAPLNLAEAVDVFRLEIEESLRQGEFERAETQLRSSRELRETAPWIYHDLLGRALLSQPVRFREAEVQFREALRHDPDYEPARRNLAHLQARTEGSAAPPGTSAGPAGGEGLDLSRGRSLVRQFQRGELEQLHRSFSPGLAAQMSVDALRQMQLEVSRRLGAETEVLDETIMPGPNFRIYTRTARFENHAGEIDFVVQLNEEREIVGLEFRPSRRTAGRP